MVKTDEIRTSEFSAIAETDAVGSWTNDETEGYPLLPEGTVARLLGYSLKTLQAWRGKRIGPRYVKGPGRHGGVRYRRGDVEEFVRSRTVLTDDGSCGPSPVEA